MPAHQDPAALYLPPTPDTSESAMTTLYRAALGPVNAERYLPRLARFDALGRTRPGWNWAACACTLNWMALRHLWSAALVYVAVVEGLGLLIFGVGRSLLQWPDAVQWGLMAVFAGLAFILPGLYGDAVLHSEIRKRIARALAATRTIPEACTQLGRQASSWKRLIGLALLNLVLVGAASAAFWYLPQGGPATRPAPPEAPRPIIEPPPVTPPPTEPVPAPAPEAALAASAAAPLAHASAPAPATAPASAPPVLATPAPLADTQDSAPPQRASVAALPPAQAASQPKAPPDMPRRAPPAQASTAPAVSSPVSVATPVAASATNGASHARPPEVGKAPGYYINVGLFAEEANARRAQARLLNEGHPAFRQSLETAKGKRIR
ncbi:MAG: DUF2628 domain-containing protein, partial [Giesbergeria sp.]|nr:DUF2628 domain-containing protein [Giesbergeria sp.]